MSGTTHGFDSEQSAWLINAFYGLMLSGMSGRRTRHSDPKALLPFQVSYFEGDSDETLAQRELPGWVEAAIREVPLAALKRSALTRIIQYNHPLWFAPPKDGKPQVTSDVTKAISPMALVPSKVEYARSATHPLGWEMTIYIWMLPELYEDTKTRIERRVVGRTSTIRLCDGKRGRGISLRAGTLWLMAHQALTHEIIHTVTGPILHGGTDRPIVINGQPVDPFQFLTDLVTMAEGKPPISNYASAYMEADNTVRKTGNYINNVDEVLVEHLAALLLGWSTRMDGTVSPLRDRDEMRHLLWQFLLADWADEE